MSRKNPPFTPMPAKLRAHLDELIRRYQAARLKENHLKRRMYAMTARLRVALAEIMDRYYTRFGRVEKRHKDISDEFLRLWSKHFPDAKSVSLPSAVVRQMRRVKVTVVDKYKVVDALDRLNRMDLVDETVNEKGLRALAREGKLDDLSDDAVEIDRKPRIMVYARKDD